MFTLCQAFHSGTLLRSDLLSAERAAATAPAPPFRLLIADSDIHVLIIRQRKGPNIAIPLKQWGKGVERWPNGSWSAPFDDCSQQQQQCRANLKLSIAIQAATSSPALPSDQRRPKQSNGT